MAKFSDVNNVPATGAESVYRLKEVLKAAGWTVVESSDGTTFSAVNGDTITSGGAGAGGFNRTLAWMRLRDPGARREIVFQRIASNSFRVKFSELARFTAGATVTVTPSATDEFVRAGGGTDASPTGATNWISSGTDGNYRFHCIAQSTPTGNVYPWYFISATTGTGVLQSYNAFEPFRVGTYDAANVSPCVHMWATGSGGWLMNDLRQNFGITHGWFRYGLSGATLVTYIFGASHTFAGGGGNFFPGLAGPNPYNGADDTLPLYFARQPAVFSSQQGMFGVAEYLRVKGTNRTYPNTINLATDAYIYVGDLLMPWPNGVTPSV